MTNNEEGAHKSLGLISLPKDTLDFDFKLMERYQGFSAELLRIALLSITAIAYVAARFIEEKPVFLPSYAKYLLLAALVILAISAASALAHRYFSADSMACHIKAMRHFKRGRGNLAEAAGPPKRSSLWKTLVRIWNPNQTPESEEDDVQGKRELRYRDDAFLFSARALLISTASLAVGAILIALALVIALSCSLVLRSTANFA